jgi:quercetin dioxygenase-like cupin family protein
MIRLRWTGCTLAATVLTLGLGQPLQAQEGVGHAVVRNLAETRLEPTPGFPPCVRGAVQSGDPATGPSVLVGEMDGGCTVPWHWHTATEHLMMVSGEALIEMRDGTARPLRAGGFGLMPARHVHQFRCTTRCTLFVYSDQRLDIHYVDAEGNPISLEEALMPLERPTREREL